MLRLLIAWGLLTLVGWSSSYAEYTEPTQEQLQTQQQEANSAIDKIDNWMFHTEVPTAVLNQGINDLALPSLEGQQALFDKIEATALSEKINPTGANNQEAIAPIVLVSQSMPKSSLQALLKQANKYQAMVVVRGLPEGDLIEEINQLRKLAEGSGSGFAIDPTLFTRFQVDTVPTFILPMTPLEPCTELGCTTPRHVKATGDVSIGYFLELITRLGQADEKSLAQGQLNQANAKP